MANPEDITMGSVDYRRPPIGFYRLSDLPPEPWGAPSRDNYTVWTPNTPQMMAMSSPVDEIFLGGAKGGGKTDWLLADFAKHEAQHGRAARGIVFRRTLPEFTDMKSKAMAMFRGLAEYREKNGVGIWTWPSGATLRMAYLDSLRHVGRYQGQEYSWIGWDELTEWAAGDCYTFMFTCMRSIAGAKGKMRGTGNPGRPGHSWVKYRFIDPMDDSTIIRDARTGMTRTFIPARLEDNTDLWMNDPQYENRMLQLGDKVLIRALRYGDWELFVGQALHEWNKDLHVRERLVPDKHWDSWCSLDWGTATPYAWLYYTRMPNGRIVQFRERYGIATDEEDRPKLNVGNGDQASRVAREEWDRARFMGIDTVVVDDDVNKDRGLGTTVRQQLVDQGWTVVNADKRRLDGKAAVHHWLGSLLPDQYPLFQVTEDCPHTIRTLPTLVYNSRKGNREDVDTESEDHCYDALRYSAMSSFARDSVGIAERYLQGSFMDRFGAHAVGDGTTHWDANTVELADWDNRR